MDTDPRLHASPAPPFHPTSRTAPQGRVRRTHVGLQQLPRREYASSVTKSNGRGAAPWRKLSSDEPAGTSANRLVPLSAVLACRPVSHEHLCDPLEHGHPHGGDAHKGHAHDHTRAPGRGDWAEHGARLELEGDVTMPLLREAIEAMASAAGSPDDVGRVLDLGSGPGVASVALAQRFPLASITAVDVSRPLLDLIPVRAARLGVGERVVTMVADLEQGLADVSAAGSIDVAWASMVLHHVAALPETLAGVQRLLRPGGLIAVMEFGHREGSLPDAFDVGRQGFVERLAEAVLAAVEEHLPPGAMSLDWPALLTDAGFDLLDHRKLTIHLPAPLDDPARQFVLHALQTSVHVAAGRLDDTDRGILTALVDEDDPRCILHRDDLHLDVSRTFVLARRR